MSRIILLTFDCFITSSEFVLKNESTRGPLDERKRAYYREKITIQMKWSEKSCKDGRCDDGSMM